MRKPEQAVYRDVLINQRPVNPVTRWRNLESALFLCGCFGQLPGHVLQASLNGVTINDEAKHPSFNAHIYNLMMLLHSKRLF